MTFKEYLRQLTIKERAELGVQVHAKASYLNKLASLADSNASINLAYAVLESDFNAALPAAFQFTQEDYIGHRVIFQERRLNKV